MRSNTINDPFYQSQPQASYSYHHHQPILHLVNVETSFPKIVLL
jgi:hypothetical protein